MHRVCYIPMSHMEEAFVQNVIFSVMEYFFIGGYGWKGANISPNPEALAALSSKGGHGGRGRILENSKYGTVASISTYERKNIFSFVHVLWHVHRKRCHRESRCKRNPYRVHIFGCFLSLQYTFSLANIDYFYFLMGLTQFYLWLQFLLLPGLGVFDVAT